MLSSRQVLENKCLGNSNMTLTDILNIREVLKLCTEPVSPATQFLPENCQQRIARHLVTQIPLISIQFEERYSIR
jgi:hypothetical protein